MAATAQHEAHDQLIAQIVLLERRLEAADKQRDALDDGGDLAEQSTALHDRCQATKAKVASWSDVEIGLPTAVQELEAAVDAYDADVGAAAPTEAHGYEVAVDRQVRAWRSRIDRLRLQGTLGTMEARDDLDELAGRLDRVRGDVLVELQNAIGDSKGLLVDLRLNVDVVLSDVRRAVEKAAADVRAR